MNTILCLWSWSNQFSWPPHDFINCFQLVKQKFVRRTARPEEPLPDEEEKARLLLGAGVGSASVRSSRRFLPIKK